MGHFTFLTRAAKLARSVGLVAKARTPAPEMLSTADKILRRTMFLCFVLSGALARAVSCALSAILIAAIWAV